VELAYLRHVGQYDQVKEFSNDPSTDLSHTRLNLTKLGRALFSCSMKNVTITLEEDVARWARVWAAEHDTSVSRILGDTLKEKMRKERSYGRAQARYFARSAKPLKESARKYPARDELYEH